MIYLEYIDEKLIKKRKIYELSFKKSNINRNVYEEESINEKNKQEETKLN